MADTSVKWFSSSQAGMPVLSGTVGSLIAVLDACLVNGMNLVTVDSIVVAGGVGTITRAAGLQFNAHQVALIAGATPSGLNGEKKLVSVTSTTATFDATGISDQTATGTITAKLAPAGWAKAFSGTNKAAYRSNDPAAYPGYLRIDDTATYSARAYAAEGMTDVDTVTNRFPTDAQQTGGLYISRSSTANSTARSWVIAADSRCVMIFNGANATYPTQHGAFFFGDTLRKNAADSFASYICGSTTENYSTANMSNTVGELTTTDYSGWFARDFLGYANSVNGYRTYPGYTGAGSVVSGHGTLFSLYPDMISGGLRVCKMKVLEAIVSTGPYRADIPGFYYSLTAFGTNYFTHGTIVTADDDFSGRKLLTIGGYSGVGRCFVDITGPWR